MKWSAVYSGLNHESSTKQMKVEAPSEFWSPYAQSSRAVRTWFLAFGIGAPAIFVTNERAGAVLVNSGYARLVVILFLAGVAMQVILGVLYKHAMGYLYLYEHNASVNCRRVYKSWCWITEAFWLEFAIDILTVAVFAAASVITLNVFMP